MQPVLNIAAYRFVQIGDVHSLREHLLALARGHTLRGTILLAEEGINFCLAGLEDPLRAFLAALQGDARFAGLEVKESWWRALPGQLLRLRRARGPGP